MLPISVVIIAKNEADRIGECIASVIEHFAEVIVLDNGSTDDTVLIAKKLGAKVVTVEWLGYGQTKNIGNNQAKFDWILSLDSDESVSLDLVAEVQRLELTDRKVYSFDRHNHYMGKRIKHSGWSPDRVLRLFHRDDISWNDSKVHEKLEVPAGYEVINLDAHLIHHSYRSVDDHIKKTKKYALLKAQSWVAMGSKPSIVKFLFGAPFKAFQSYVLRLGFLDGKSGWQIAKMNAFLVREQLRAYQSLKSKDHV